MAVDGLIVITFSDVNIATDLGDSMSDDGFLAFVLIIVGDNVTDVIVVKGFNNG